MFRTRAHTREVASRLLAGLAALLTVGVLVAVFAITRDQGDSPAWWFVALLVVAVAGLGYGAAGGPRRGTVLTAASALVLILGVLAVFSVGLILLVAGVLGVVASRTTVVSARGVVLP